MRGKIGTEQAPTWGFPVLEDTGFVGRKSIDWDAVRQRVFDAAATRGVEATDLSALFGLNYRSNSFGADVERLPKMTATLIIAAYLGVPAAWLLTGKGGGFCNGEEISLAVSDTTDSTVVQGNRAGTMIIYNNAPPDTTHKHDLNRVFDSLSVREQVKVLDFALNLKRGNMGTESR